MEIKLLDLLTVFSLMSVWIGIFDWNIALILRAGKTTATFSVRKFSEEVFVVLPEFLSCRRSVGTQRYTGPGSGSHVRRCRKQKALLPSCPYPRHVVLNTSEWAVKLALIWHATESGKWFPFTLQSLLCWAGTAAGGWPCRLRGLQHPEASWPQVANRAAESQGKDMWGQTTALGACRHAPGEALKWRPQPPATHRSCLQERCPRKPPWASVGQNVTAADWGCCSLRG